MSAGYSAEQAIGVVCGLLERAGETSDGEDFVRLVEAATEVARGCCQTASAEIEPEK